MHCEHCHDKEATVHLIMEGADGKKRSVHLCLGCALKTGLPGDLPLPPEKLADVLKQFGETIGGPLSEALQQASSEPPADEPVSSVCPECGTSDAEFRRRQRLGCPACYEVFEKEIRALLPSLHRKGTNHRGRGPAKTQTDSRERLLRRERLKQQLALAIAAEAYERASLLRDELARLEEEENGGTACP